ncbi:MAG: DUF484 family protein [Pseudomonadota bacterium]
MSTAPKIDDALREAIMLRPDVILNDSDLMHALVAANDRSMGSNVVDMRGLAMERLQKRLERLEDTHRNVIAAAYENLAGTNQVQRAVLALLEPADFETFLHNLKTTAAEALRVDTVRLVLETVQRDLEETIAPLEDVLSVERPGFIDAYLAHGRSGPVRKVTLRQLQNPPVDVYRSGGDWVRSEAGLKLDLGEGRLPGLLLLGAEDPHMFTPQQGTDLLGFFTGVFERMMRRYLG